MCSIQVDELTIYYVESKTGDASTGITQSFFENKKSCPVRPLIHLTAENIVGPRSAGEREGVDCIPPSFPVEAGVVVCRYVAESAWRAVDISARRDEKWGQTGSCYASRHYTLTPSIVISFYTYAYCFRLPRLRPQDQEAQRRSQGDRRRSMDDILI